MKKLLVLFVLLIALKATPQKQSWTTYFPVSDDVVGHSFLGLNPMDARVQEDLENVVIKTSSSSTTLTKEQKYLTEFSLNNLFQKYKIGVARVDAYAVKIDRLNKESLNEMPRNVPFVYAALKADSSVITFRKYKTDTIQSAPVIDSLKKIYPKISESDLGKFIDFLKFTTDKRDSVEYNMTIKDPNVYFLIQVAEIDSKGSWENACASFLSRNKPYHFVDRFTLIDSADLYTTGYAETHFSWRSKGQKAKVYLEIDQANNLIMRTKISPTDTGQVKILKERNGTWNKDNIVVKSYPYKARKGIEYYKDILLTINARREANKIIIESGADEKQCGETYLNYPESEFHWKTFRLQ